MKIYISTLLLTIGVILHFNKTDNIPRGSVLFPFGRGVIGEFTNDDILGRKGGCFGCVGGRVSITADVWDVVLDKSRKMPLGVILYDLAYWKFHYDRSRAERIQGQTQTAGGSSPLPEPRGRSRRFNGRSNQRQTLPVPRHQTSPVPLPLPPPDPHKPRPRQLSRSTTASGHSAPLH